MSRSPESDNQGQCREWRLTLASVRCRSCADSSLLVQSLQEVVVGRNDEGGVSQLRRRREAQEARAEPVVDLVAILVRGGAVLCGLVPAGDRLLPEPARAMRDVQPVRPAADTQHRGLERAVRGTGPAE